MKSKKACDLERLKDALASRAHTFCESIFPKGGFKARNYMVGNLGGPPGNSLRICVYGPKAGIRKDFAAGERGNNLLDLLYTVRDGEFSSAWEEAANWLSCPENLRYDSEDVRQSNITETEIKYPICTPYLSKTFWKGKFLIF
jgi:hypothetical protein